MKCHFSLVPLLLMSGSLLLLLSGCLQTPTLACFPCENDSQCAAPLTCSPRLKRCVVPDGAADQCDGAGESGGTEKNDESLSGDSGAEQVAEQAVPSELGGDDPAGEGLAGEGLAEEASQAGEPVGEGIDGSPPQEPVVTDAGERAGEQATPESGPEPKVPEEPTTTVEKPAGLEKKPDLSPCEKDAKLNTACSAGQGACKETGKWVCSGDKQRVVCNAVADLNKQKPEECNGVDDDCDGMVDDGIAPQACYTGSAGTRDVGPCKAGTRSCVNGKWSACNGQVVPIAENCKNCVDDDCDGSVNDNCSWALSFSGSKSSKGVAVEADGQCNVYLLGEYSGNLSVDGKALPSVSASSSVFISKIGPGPSVQWAVAGRGASIVEGAHANIDSQGSVYISGRFKGALTFGSLPPLTVSTAWGSFVAKLDRSGKPLWSREITSSTATRVVRAVTLPSGITTVFGYFSRDLRCGAHRLSATNIYYTDLFLARFNANGGCQWLMRLGGNNTEIADSLAVDTQGNSYIAGRYGSSTSLGSYRLTHGDSGTHGFVAMVTPTKQVLWAYQPVLPASEQFYDLAVDPQRNVYVAGTYRNNADFGNNIKLTTSSNVTQVYVLKLGPTGKAVWAAETVSSAFVLPSAIQVGGAGAPTLVGQFTGSLLAGSYNFAGGSLRQTFLLRVAADGKSFTHGVYSSAVGSGTNVSIPYGLALTAPQFVLTGAFNGNNRFGGSTLRATLQSIFLWVPAR